MRNYKRKRGVNPPEKIKEALDEVLNGHNSLNSVSERLSIPKATLHRYLKKTKENDVDLEHLKTGYSNHKQIFTESQEHALVHYLKFAANIYYGLCPKDIKILAYDCAISFSIQIPDSCNRDKMAGPDWFAGLMKRHISLSLRVPEATSLSRSTSFNRENVSQFYSKLADVIERFNIRSSDIYNVDETGITTVQKLRSIVASKGVKQIASMTSGERGTLITMCFAVSAQGNTVPPLIIFPRKRFKDHFIRDGPQGCIGAANKSGWINAEHFLDFMKHFVDHVRPSKEKPVLLLLDNHSSHLSIPVLDYAKQHGVVMLSFPPHTSHKIQPLDRSVYGPLKKAINYEQDKWMRNNQGKTITIYDLPNILNKTLPVDATPKNIMRGFQVAGINPICPEIFTDNDFSPSFVTDRRDPVAQDPAKLKPHETQTSPNSVEETDKADQHSGLTAVERTVSDLAADDPPLSGWVLIKKFLQRKAREIEDVQADGHCLLYAVQKSLSYQSQRKITISEMCNRLRQEIQHHSQFYLKFCESSVDLEEEIEKYIRDKRYDTNTGDMVLAALATALGLKVVVVEVVAGEVKELEVKPERDAEDVSITIALHNEHYNAIRPVMSQAVTSKIYQTTQNDGTDSTRDMNRTNANPVDRELTVNDRSEILFTPEAVRPFPKAGDRKLDKPRPRKRKFAVLTDTPEKAKLEEEARVRKPKPVKKSNQTKAEKKKKVVHKKRKSVKTKLCDSNDSSDDEYYCLACLEPYSNSRAAEKWVQCVSCKNWAHEECVNPGLLYTCINCDSDDSYYAY